MPTFVRSCRVPVPADTLFAWHERPGAFERLTPPWAPVRVLARSGGIRDGARVTVRVPIAGPLGLRWTLEHHGYRAGVEFNDRQVRGPFARWHHRHHVAPDGPAHAVLTDTLDFAAPMPWLGGRVVEALVLRDLARLFAHRHAVTAGDLARHAAAALPPRRIVISGATGFLGAALDAFLSTGGHAVQRLVRGAPDPARAHPDIPWDPDRGVLDAAALHGVDAVIHLAGASVASRWTPAHRAAIRESRVRGTALLARAFADASAHRTTAPPRAFLAGSAVGIYGDRGDETLDETSPRGAGWLADVAADWEAAAEPARAAGIRTAWLRTGIVLGAGGGALAKLLPPFRLGLGGPIGDGRHWMPWIALDDWLGAVLHVLATPTLDGPVNLVGPAPARNAAFTAALGAVLQRPAVLPVPPAALALAYTREMVRETLLASTRAVPRALDASGFAFRHPTLEGALRAELGVPSS